MHIIYLITHPKQTTEGRRSVDTTCDATVGSEEHDQEIGTAELRAIAFDPALEHQHERVMRACANGALKEGPKFSLYLADVQAFHAGGGTSNQVKARRLFYSLRSRLLYAPTWCWLFSHRFGF